MYICEICGTKKRPKKNLCISVKSVGQNFHRISRMNQRHSCLSDYSRICADIWPLANGSRPICAAIVFGHADFADDADFSSWDYFCPTDFTDLHRFFFVGLFCPTDFTDIHRFFMESLVNRFVRSQGYLQRPNRSPLRNSVSNRRNRKSPNKFRVIR